MASFWICTHPQPAANRREAAGSPWPWFQVLAVHTPPPAPALILGRLGAGRIVLEQADVVQKVLPTGKGPGRAWRKASGQPVCGLGPQGLGSLQDHRPGPGPQSSYRLERSQPQRTESQELGCA